MNNPTITLNKTTTHAIPIKINKALFDLIKAGHQPKIELVVGQKPQLVVDSKTEALNSITENATIYQNLDYMQMIGKSAVKYQMQPSTFSNSTAKKVVKSSILLQDTPDLSKKTTKIPLITRKIKEKQVLPELSVKELAELRTKLVHLLAIRKLFLEEILEKFDYDRHVILKECIKIANLDRQECFCLKLKYYATLDLGRYSPAEESCVKRNCDLAFDALGIPGDAGERKKFGIEKTREEMKHQMLEKSSSTDSKDEKPKKSKSSPGSEKKSESTKKRNSQDLEDDELPNDDKKERHIIKINRNFNSISSTTVPSEAANKKESKNKGKSPEQKIISPKRIIQAKKEGISNLKIPDIKATQENDTSPAANSSSTKRKAEGTPGSKGKKVKTPEILDIPIRKKTEGELTKEPIAPKKDEGRDEKRDKVDLNIIPFDFDSAPIPSYRKSPRSRNNSGASSTMKRSVASPAKYTPKSIYYLLDADDWKRMEKTGLQSYKNDLETRVKVCGSRVLSFKTVSMTLLDKLKDLAEPEKVDLISTMFLEEFGWNLNKEGSSEFGSGILEKGALMLEEYSALKNELNGFKDWAENNAIVLN